MSQVSATAGDGQATARPATKTPTGRAVFLLAVFVILGVWLLHELDSSPATTTPLAQTEDKADDKKASTNNATQAQSQTQTSSQTNTATQTQTTTPVSRTPSDIKLLVANGVGVNGVAAKIAGRLQPFGYQMLKSGNTTAKMTTSQVQYAEGYLTDAQAVATALGLSSSAVVAMPNPASISDLQGANIVVIVGNELATAATGASLALSGPLSAGNSTTGTGTGTNSGATSTNTNTNASAGSTTGNSTTAH